MDSNRINAVHFIGIGGVGMSGIARVAFDQGMQVSGSDLKESRYTKQLKSVGIKVHIGHGSTNIPPWSEEGLSPDVVVVSTAILSNNVELKAAQDRGLVIWHRAQMLAYLGRDLHTLAVAGTHGKTTTSSMLASVLDALGDNPTFLIGGIVRSYSTNAHSGEGSHYVVEADESDKSFTYLSPHAVLVTNIEADHLDHYKDLNEIHEKFSTFISSVPEKEGLVVVCGDDEVLVDIARTTGRRVITYGFEPSCDVQIEGYTPSGVGSLFKLKLIDGRRLKGQLKQNPGKHNVLNAVGVLSLVDALHFNVEDAAKALAQFAGVRRRFDLVGEVSGVTVIDDYAHHPTEIRATIEAAAQLDYRRVHVLFQPHRYSRAPLFTQVLRHEFGSAFDAASSVTFMDVYPAGEAPVPGVSGKTFLNVVLDHAGHPEAAYVPRRADVVPYLVSKAESGDLVITMGAGDVTALGPQLLEALQSKEPLSEIRG